MIFASRNIGGHGTCVRTGALMNTGWFSCWLDDWTFLKAKINPMLFTLVDNQALKFTNTENLVEAWKWEVHSLNIRIKDLNFHKIRGCWVIRFQSHQFLCTVSIKLTMPEKQKGRKLSKILGSKLVIDGCAHIGSIACYIQIKSF